MQDISNRESLHYTYNFSEVKFEVNNSKVQKQNEVFQIFN